jgi:DNA segregation ATPase FtsK/SpoIIIE, S-DNA-T family
MSSKFRQSSKIKQQNQSHSKPKHLDDEAITIERVAKAQNIDAQAYEIHRGPVFTTYAFDTKPETRADQVKQLENWLCDAISVPFVHITHSPSQTNRYYLEIPNKGKQLIRFSELVRKPAFQEAGEGAMAFGVDADGGEVIICLKDLPHLLVAGDNTQEKVRLINSIISSLAIKLEPSIFKILLIDSKMSDFYIYKDCPHLLTPVVSDVKQSVVWLQWLDMEVEERHQKMATSSVQQNSAVKNKKQEQLAQPTILVVMFPLC